MRQQINDLARPMTRALKAGLFNSGIFFQRQMVAKTVNVNIPTQAP
jgi:hypothetical protein